MTAKRASKPDKDKENATLDSLPKNPFGNNQPFSMAKMEYEANRKRKRKKLLLWSLPVTLIVGLVALWFLLPWPLTFLSINSYNNKAFQPARNWINPLTWTSPQPFIAAFDSGTTDAQLRNYDRAEKELTKALALAPTDKRCMVLQNLVFALDAHAMDLQSKGATGDAANYTSQAKSYINGDHQCFPNISTQKKDDQGGGGGGGGGGGAQAESNQVLSSSQAQQLQQKNQQGQDTTQQEFLQTMANADAPAAKPW